MGGFLTESFFYTGDRKKAQSEFARPLFIEFFISTRGIKGALKYGNYGQRFPMPSAELET
jgi:hypothetical protein